MKMPLLIEIYSNCAVSILSKDFEETLPNTIFESCLSYTFPISTFNDGSKYICSKKFINKYKIKLNYSHLKIAHHIINIIIHYNKYVKNIIHESYLITIKKWDNKNEH